MDKRLRFTAKYIVAKKNIATVWVISSHLKPPLVRLAGFSNAPIHLKNRAMTTPRMMDRTDPVSENSRTHNLVYHRVPRTKGSQTTCPSQKCLPGGDSVERQNRGSSALAKNRTWLKSGESRNRMPGEGGGRESDRRRKKRGDKMLELKGTSGYRHLKGSA